MAKQLNHQIFKIIIKEKSKLAPKYLYEERRDIDV
jgi:hypothetical protein